MVDFLYQIGPQISYSELGEIQIAILKVS